MDTNEFRKPWATISESSRPVKYRDASDLNRVTGWYFLKSRLFLYRADIEKHPNSSLKYGRVSLFWPREISPAEPPLKYVNCTVEDSERKWYRHKSMFFCYTGENIKKAKDSTPLPDWIREKIKRHYERIRR